MWSYINPEKGLKLSLWAFIWHWTFCNVQYVSMDNSCTPTGTGARWSCVSSLSLFNTLQKCLPFPCQYCGASLGPLLLWCSLPQATLRQTNHSYVHGRETCSQLFMNFSVSQGSHSLWKHWSYGHKIPIIINKPVWNILLNVVQHTWVRCHCRCRCHYISLWSGF